MVASVLDDHTALIFRTEQVYQITQLHIPEHAPDC